MTAENHPTWVYVMMYKISGTEPQKETYLSLRTTLIENLKGTIMKIIYEIYKEIIHIAETKPIDSYQDAYVENYRTELKEWITVMETGDNWEGKLNQLSDKLAKSRYYMLKGRLFIINQRFSEPYNSVLITVNFITNSDFHYYLEWKPFPQTSEEPVEWKVHDQS